MTHNFDDQLKDLNALAGESELKLSRRSLLKSAAVGGFIAGYAAAAQPVFSQTVETSSAGLDAGQVLVDVGGDQMFAYRVRPAHKKHCPVILIVPEIFGVHAYIEDVCRRFAQAGFYAIAPEIFFRHSDPGQYSTAAEIMSNVISKMDDAQVMADLDRLVDHAFNEGADTGRLAVTGFCWGGRITWLYAAHQPRVKAGVAWYGRLVGAKNALTPKQAVDLAGDLKAPVLGLYGAEDTGIPLETVEQMRNKLAEAAQSNPNAANSRIEVFAGAQHGFHADYRNTYNSTAAKEAYNQALQFLRSKNLL